MFSYKYIIIYSSSDEIKNDNTFVDIVRDMALLRPANVHKLMTKEVNLCIYKYVYSHICICLYICAYMYIYVCIYMRLFFVHIYFHVYTNLYYICIYIYACMYIYVYIYACMYIYVHVYIFIRYIGRSFRPCS
jgi:hypothetical protein